MFVKAFTLITILVGVLSIWMALTQQSAFVLRQENQDQHWSHSTIRTSGYYNTSRRRWEYSSRENYAGFRGGGPGAGK